VRQLCEFLCHPAADQINVMSIEVNTGSYEYSNLTPLRRNSWLPLPYPTRWHMDWRCVFDGSSAVFIWTVGSLRVALCTAAAAQSCQPCPSEQAHNESIVAGHLHTRCLSTQKPTKGGNGGLPWKACRRASVNTLLRLPA